jgi:cell division septum initiation protein DivIVA
MWFVIITTACVPKQAELETLQTENAALQAQVEELDTRVSAIEAQLSTVEMFLQFAETAINQGLGASSSDDTPAGTSSGVLTSEPACEQLEDGRYRLLPSFSPDDFTTLSQTVRMTSHQDASGETDGFRLSSIRVNSAPRSCGFLNGDIIHSIGGHNILSVAQAMEAYMSLEGMTSAEVTVTRRAQRHSWTILASGQE